MDTQAETFPVSADDVRAAADLIRGDVLRTPLIPAPRLSELTGADVFVKYENLQVTNSFKDRGALVKLLSLSEADRRRGVIAMSAGNHAQSVAYHSARLGVPAVIVMPETTPYVKVGNTEALGAEVVLSGATLADSRGRMEEISAERQLTLVHPYDDTHIIAGQGTVALEVLDDQPELDVLVIPIGGGGLIAGSAIAAKAVRPEIEIVGVEAALFPSMYHAVRGETGECGGQTLAEGIAVKMPGELTVPIVKALVSEIVLVDEETIERAICVFASLQKTMAEGAGAAGLAAMLARPDAFAGRKVGLYLCGGNIDPRVLASVIVRGLGREGKIVSLRITISDQPGMLGRIASLLGEERANILEVSHRRMFLDVPAKGATLDLMIETKDRAHARQVMARLADEGFPPRELESPGGREIAAD
ncbi:MAG: threonine ammonia-lyase [Hyphomicrobiales bacterium]|nr:threonine ammonia-lyase [Hyphomicrobiales bacterium]